MSAKQKAEAFNQIRVILQDAAIEFLKEQAVKTAIKAFFKSGVGVGFKAWAIKFVVVELVEELGEPIVKAFFVEAGYRFEKINGNIMVTRLQRAREEGNVEDYNSTVDDILG